VEYALLDKIKVIDRMLMVTDHYYGRLS